MRSLSFVAHATSSGPTSSSAPNTPRAMTHTAQDNGSVQHCSLLLCRAPGICLTISFRYGGAVSWIESPISSIRMLTTAPPFHLWSWLSRPGWLDPEQVGDVQDVVSCGVTDRQRDIEPRPRDRVDSTVAVRQGDEQPGEHLVGPTGGD